MAQHFNRDHGDELANICAERMIPFEQTTVRYSTPDGREGGWVRYKFTGIALTSQPPIDANGVVGRYPSLRERSDAHDSADDE